MSFRQGLHRPGANVGQMRRNLDEIVLTRFRVPDRVPNALAKSAWNPRHGELRNGSLLGFVCATDLPDQPWKIARMNKITYALALGAGLVLSLASPNAQADPIVQTLTPTPMSASQFNSLYTPSTTVLTAGYDFMNTPNAGVVESQVFTGIGTAAGTYAYAYQFGVNSAVDTSIQQLTSVNSASMLFNATPTGTDFTHTGTNTYAY